MHRGVFGSATEPAAYIDRRAAFRPAFSTSCSCLPGASIKCVSQSKYASARPAGVMPCVSRARFALKVRSTPAKGVRFGASKLPGCGNDSLGPIGCDTGRSRLVCRECACSDAAFSASDVRSLSWGFRIDLPPTTMKVAASAECSTVGGSSVVERLVNCISHRCRCHRASA